MAVPTGAIEGIIRLRDEMSPKIQGIKGNLRSLAPVVGAAGAALSGFALAAGNSFETARATIAQGTGATGEVLDGLTASFQRLAGTIPGVGSPEVATAIADLNTHLGLTGDELEDVSAKALKAGVDTNRFGGIAKQLGLDAAGASALLDDLTAAAQQTGVDVDIMTNAIGKGSARWLAAGGTMEGLTATVVQAAGEFGPAGLRGAMSEILQEVDRGVIPSFQTLEQQLGDTAGTVERTHAASVTFLERLTAMKDRAAAVVGPMGSAAGAVGSVASGAVLAAPHIGTMGKALTGAATAARGAIAALGPVGLALTIGTLLVAAIVKAQGKLGELHRRIEEFSTLTEEEMAQAITDVDARITGLRESMDQYGDALGETSSEIAELEEKKAELIVQLNEARRRTREAKEATEEQTVSLIASTVAVEDNKEALARLAKAEETAARWASDMRREVYEAHREFQIARQEAELLNYMLDDSTIAFGSVGEKVDTEVTPAMQTFVDGALANIKRDIPTISTETETWGRKFDATMTAVDNVASALTRLTGNSFFGKIGGWIRLVASLRSEIGGIVGAARAALSALGALRGGSAGAVGALPSATSLGGVAAPGAAPGAGAGALGAVGAAAGAAALTGATYAAGRGLISLVNPQGRYSVEDTRRRFPGAGSGGRLVLDEPINIDGEEVARITARREIEVAEEEGW